MASDTIKDMAAILLPARHGEPTSRWASRGQWWKLETEKEEKDEKEEEEVRTRENRTHTHTHTHTHTCTHAHAHTRTYTHRHTQTHTHTHVHTHTHTHTPPLRLGAGEDTSIACRCSRVRTAASASSTCAQTVAEWMGWDEEGGHGEWTVGRGVGNIAVSLATHTHSRTHTPPRVAASLQGSDVAVYADLSDVPECICAFEDPTQPAVGVVLVGSANGAFSLVELGRCCGGSCCALGIGAPWCSVVQAGRHTDTHRHTHTHRHTLTHTHSLPHSHTRMWLTQGRTRSCVGAPGRDAISGGDSHRRIRSSITRRSKRFGWTK